MFVHAIFGNQVTDEIDVAVANAFPDNLYKLAPGQWLVRDVSSLSAEVYKKLIGNEDHVRCVITRLSGYYGWHDKAIWDWVEESEKRGS